MKEGSEIYGEFTLSRIRKALKSEPLSERQIRLIRVALAVQDDTNKHSFDLRWTLPIGFQRLYFCFFAGVDRRSGALKLQAMRRATFLKRVRGSVLLGLLSLLSIGLSYGLFMGLYQLKRALGIDIFPNFHLQDLFPWIS